MKYYIGWDVGAWHCNETGSGSKDALAIIDKDLRLLGSPWEGNLSDVILQTSGNEEQGRPLAFIRKLLCKCKIETDINQDADEFYVAVDTPLGWPKQFMQLLQSWSNGIFTDMDGNSTVNLREGKIRNPFLHRKTEVAIGQSLSAVQDQIGSQSTKAICLLNALRVSRESTGVWRTTSPEITFIETYPAPCMRSFAFIDSLKEVFVNKRIDSEDIFDAIICAFLANCYSFGSASNLVDFPSDEISKEEGWIFTPKKCLNASFGVSYGRLLGTQSPIKSFSELLSQVQIGMVMKSLIKSSRRKAQNKSTEVCASSELLKDWLNLRTSNDDALRFITAEDLKALFKMLNPKAEPKQYPSENLFENIANLIQSKVRE